MNQLTDVTINNITANGGIINNANINGGFIDDAHMTPGSIFIKDSTIISIGEKTILGSDLRELIELMEIKDFLKKIVEERFPQYHI